MIRVIGIMFSLLELCGFLAMAYFARAMHQPFAWFFMCCVVAALSASSFVLRLRERSFAADIADAEDKLVKRCLRRLEKTHIDGAKLVEMLQPVVERHVEIVAGKRHALIADEVEARLVGGGIIRDAVKIEIHAQQSAEPKVSEAIQAAIEKTFVDMWLRMSKEQVG